MRQLGFIGLGNMGAPMARNLIAAGFAVKAYDVASSPSDIPLASSLEDVVADQDAIVLMLPNGPICEQVAQSILPLMRHGSVLIDCSTIDVATARRIANHARDHHIHAFDAPVSGGVGGATAATLTFMIGGDENAFHAIRPILEAMGKKLVFCGPHGNGQAAKLCNNMILGVTMIATSEAFGLADHLGLSRQALYDVVSSSSGQSWSMTTYCPAPGIGPQSPADNDYRPGFASELMLKDLTLSQLSAKESGAETPMGALATALYRHFVEDEHGKGFDFSAILRRFERP